MKIENTIFGIQIYSNTNNIYKFVYEYKNENDSNEAINNFKTFVSKNNIDLNDSKYVYKSYHKASGIVDLYSPDPEEEEFYVWKPINSSQLISL